MDIRATLFFFLSISVTTSMLVMSSISSLYSLYIFSSYMFRSYVFNAIIQFGNSFILSSILKLHFSII